MGDTFLTTTSTAGLQPLGSAAQRSYELVSGTVRQRLGDAHAALFAEPVASAHGEAVDWYAAGEGTAIALSDLPEDEARDLKAMLGSRVAEISALAETLRGGDAADDRRLAETLANAIEVPDEAMIYALRRPSGELQPVLVHWSWLRDERQAVRGILTAMVPRDVPLSVAEREAEAAAAAARPPWAGWWWLILLGWIIHLWSIIDAALYERPSRWRRDEYPRDYYAREYYRRRYY